MEMSTESAIPQIPGYEITRVLGHGGMADVYLATQLSLSRQVAIKVLAAERTQGEENTARFEHEARTIAHLEHPHIVSIFDVGRTADGRLYYTMPYLPRGDLAARKLDESGIVAIVHTLCSALGYAHELGVVHRDVKPENVLFDQRDRPLLADFGIALSTRDFARVTREGSTIGSGGYMSPEQARGLPLDGRADLYSLGVVTYELLSGDLPFHGPDTLSMALAHVEQPIPRLSLPRRRWQAFIDRAMAKNPAERFQNAEQMAAALEAIGATIQRQPPLVAQPRPKTMRRSLASIIAGAAIVLGIAMLGAAIFRSRNPTPDSQDVATAPSAATTASNEPTSKPNADNATIAHSTDAAATALAVDTMPAHAEPSKDLSQAPAVLGMDGNSLVAGTVLRDRDGPELVFVPLERAGTAQGGFALARYEVTRGEYAAFVSATGRGASSCREPMQPFSRWRKLSWRHPGFAQGDQHPVVCVSWMDASAYVQWLSRRTHADYALPTRTEWLRAARAVPKGERLCAQGNLAGHSALPFLRGDGCEAGFSHTAPVGHFKANALGAYDLVGNVSEWMRGCKAGAIDKSGRCRKREFSGTSWRDDADANNLDTVGDADSDVGYTTVGIRVLRKISADNMPAPESVTK